jgi:hypothetical protein
MLKVRFVRLLWTRKDVVSLLFKQYTPFCLPCGSCWYSTVWTDTYIYIHITYILHSYVVHTYIHNTYIYTHTCIYCTYYTPTYIHTHIILASIGAYTKTYIGLHTYIHTYTLNRNIHAHIDIRTYTYIYTCVCTTYIHYIHTLHTYIHTYVRTATLNNPLFVLTSITYSIFLCLDCELHMICKSTCNFLQYHLSCLYPLFVGLQPKAPNFRATAQLWNTNLF